MRDYGRITVCAQADAEKKRHCTTGEAINVGRRMRAKTILLTHFSGRYPKLPIITDDFAGGDVALAHDHLEFR